MVIPICWHDPRIPPPKFRKAASCFVLKFSERLIGVTAAHVVEAYLTAALHIPALVALLGSRDLLNICFALMRTFGLTHDCVAGGASLIDVSGSTIRMNFEPLTDKAVEGIPRIPKGASVSGCSGAPLVVAVQVNEEPLSFTVIRALIGSSNLEKSEGGSSEYISIVARRLDCIQPDGKLMRPFSPLC